MVSLPVLRPSLAADRLAAVHGLPADVVVSAHLTEEGDVDVHGGAGGEGEGQLPDAVVGGGRERGRRQLESRDRPRFGRGLPFFTRFGFVFFGGRPGGFAG